MGTNAYEVIVGIRSGCRDSLFAVENSSRRVSVAMPRSRCNQMLIERGPSPARIAPRRLA